MLRVGFANHGLLDGAKTLCGAVTLLPFRVRSIDLDQLRVVNALSESIGDRRQVHLVAVRSQLHPVGETTGNSLKELGSEPSIPATYEPVNDELCVGVDGNENPSVSGEAAIVEHLRRDVLLLRADERPDFVNLDPFAGQAHKGLVQIGRAGRAKL